MNYSILIFIQVLLTNKYGDPVLPKTIPMEEFEDILEAVQNYYDSRYDTIRSKIEELEAEIGVPVAEKQTDTGAKIQTDDKSSVISDLSSEETKSDQSDKVSEPRVQQNVTVYRKEGEVRKNQEMIKLLKEEEAALPNPSFLTTWFRLDTNSVPPVYRLRNIR